MNLQKKKLFSILQECDKHLLRINSSYQKLPLPINKEEYDNISEDDITNLDQFLFRFTKLQDAIGKKLFKNILLYLEEDISNIAFIDLLNKLEKLGFLIDKNIWLELRNMHNDLTHEYEDDPDSATAILNGIYNQKPILEEIYIHIKNKLNILFDKRI